MKKVTKKFLGEFLTETTGTAEWSVISFDKKTGERGLSVGCFNFFNAFAVITEQLSKGYDIILTNKKGWDYIFEFERTNHRWIKYDELKPYEIVINSYSYKIN